MRKLKSKLFSSLLLVCRPAPVTLGIEHAGRLIDNGGVAVGFPVNGLPVGVVRHKFIHLGQDLPCC